MAFWWHQAESAAGMHPMGCHRTPATNAHPGLNTCALDSQPTMPTMLMKVHALPQQCHTHPGNHAMHSQGSSCRAACGQPHMHEDAHTWLCLLNNRNLLLLAVGYLWQRARATALQLLTTHLAPLERLLGRPVQDAVAVQALHVCCCRPCSVCPCMRNSPVAPDQPGQQPGGCSHA